jgi:16S rRNA processing protein RimM
MDAAQELVGCELQIHKQERAPLEPGSAYVSDLVGCDVWVVAKGAGQDELLGQIADVQFGAGEAPLLIIRSASKEYLVPYAAAYVEALELERKRLRLRLPEGMLDLDMPLTDEEKQRQHRK